MLYFLVLYSKRKQLYKICIFLKDNLKGDYIKNLPLKLSEFSKYLGDNKWLAGENVRLFDFKKLRES